MDILNPDWLGLLRSLNDAAGARIEAVTARLVAEGFDGSWLPGARLGVAVEQLGTEPESTRLVALYQMTIMHARRSAAIGSAQLDGIISVLQGTHIDDAHASVAPLARSAAEHLSLVGWLLEPNVPPRTQIARHVARVTISRNAFEGVRTTATRSCATPASTSPGSGARHRPRRGWSRQ